MLNDLNAAEDWKRSGERRVSESDYWTGLRRRAERRLVDSVSVAFGRSADNFAWLEDEDGKVRRELELCRIELEIQYEELCRRIATLEVERDDWQRLFDEAPSAYLGLDASGVIVQANLRATQLLGGGPSSPVGRSLAAFCLDDSVEKLNRLIRGILDGASGVLSVELDVRAAGGQPLALQAESRAYQCADRQLALVTLTDATAFRGAKQELRRLRAAGAGGDSTPSPNWSSSGDALLRVQKMELIGEFASGIAHDFGNVLQGILGCADLTLSNLPQDHVACRFVDELRSAAVSGADFVDQLLQFVGEQEMPQRVVDLNRLIASRDTLLARLMGEHIRIRTRFGPSIAPVRCVASQLEQVLLNLAVNARDAMPSGGTLELETLETTVGPKIVGVCPEPPPRAYVVMTVKDTGTGMTPDTLTRAFEPFFTTKGPPQGTGLGLTMVRKMVDQCNGHIDVKSASGKGTTFTLYFPRASGTLSSPRRAVGGQCGSEIVLVVENEPLVRLTVGHYLDRHGYRVLSANGVRQAINVLGAHHESIDLLLTDVVLRDGDRAAFEAQVRARFPGVRTLYMTALPRDMIPGQGEPDSTPSRLRKPFSEAELLMAVREALRDTWFQEAAAVGDCSEMGSTQQLPPPPRIPRLPGD